MFIGEANIYNTYIKKELSNFQKVKLKIQKLEKKYKELEKTHQELEKKHQALGGKCTELELKNSRLETNHRRLDTAYKTLSSHTNSLVDDPTGAVVFTSQGRTKRAHSAIGMKSKVKATIKTTHSI